MTDLTLDPVTYGHHDVVALTVQVQAYYRQIYGGEDVAPMTEDEFAAPDGLFLLARVDTEPVGMGGWRRIGAVDALGGVRIAELRRMFTVPAARHRGVARRLLAELERTAASIGMDSMVLSTGGIQKDAVSFYRGNGYRDIPPFGHWAAADGIVCLGKRLDPHDRT